MKMESDALLTFLKTVIAADLKRFDIKTAFNYDLWNGKSVEFTPPSSITVDNIYEYIKLQYPNCYDFLIQSRRS